MQQRPGGHGLVKVAAALTVVAALSVWQLATVVRERALAALAAAGNQRIELYAATVAGALATYAYLPTVLARDKDIRALLAAPDDPRLVDAVNRNLEAVNTRAQSASLYVLDAAGLTRAASNWAESESFVGRSYAFRPYFVQALASGDGHYFGVGVTTRTPGYFLATAARDGKGVAGVVVVKVDLEELQRDWARGGEAVLVSDANQVAILASRQDWKYAVLGEPDTRAAAAMAASLQYADMDLPRLDLRVEEMRAADQAVVVVGGQRFLMQSRAIGADGWVLRYFSDLAPVAQRQRDVTAMATGAALAVGLLALYLRQRRLRLRAETAARVAVAAAVSAARDTLEQTVHDRTAELRATQEELVHAGKMAALGQMSAALAHEINQPLAAIQTFLASTRVFAERGDHVTVLGNLGLIEDLVRRMAAVTGHLKAFARKTPMQREPVALAPAVDRAVLLVEPAWRHRRIQRSCVVPAGARVWGDANRLDQVLVNLLRNAGDAMADTACGRLDITAEDAGDHWAVRVADTGHGIAPEHMSTLFDPFFTTKVVGQGLGLGLSLSYGIVRSFGGTIRAENNAGGGASFVMHLPKAPTDAPNPGA